MTKTLKPAFSFVGCLIALLIAGCTKVQEVVVTQEVFVPIPCMQEAPIKPIKTGNLIEDTKNLALYAKELEIAFRTCKEQS